MGSSHPRQVERCSHDLRTPTLWRQPFGAIYPAILAAMTVLAQDVAAEGFIADQNGCRAINPAPAPNETIEWSGACEDNLLSGVGTLRWFHNGDLVNVYEGRMYKGNFDGFGKLQEVGTQRIYEGQWLNGKQHGTGELKDLEYGAGYVGDFWEGKMHGEGTRRLPNGARYEGQFSNDNFHGFGLMHLPSGDRKHGTWVSGELQGLGTYFWAAGHRYDGEFKNSLLDGRGRETHIDGTSITGTWSHGRLVKRDTENNRGFLQFASTLLNSWIASNGGKPPPDIDDPFDQLQYFTQMKVAGAQAKQVSLHQMRASAVPATQQGAGGRTLPSNSDASLAQRPRHSPAKECYFIPANGVSLAEGVLKIVADYPCADHLSSLGTVPAGKYRPVWQYNKASSEVTVGLEIDLASCRLDAHSTRTFSWNMSEMNLAASSASLSFVPMTSSTYAEAATRKNSDACFDPPRISYYSGSFRGDPISGLQVVYPDGSKEEYEHQDTSKIRDKRFTRK
jgi:hypothetical protein